VPSAVLNLAQIGPGSSDEIEVTSPCDNSRPDSQPAIPGNHGHIPQEGAAPDFNPRNLAYLGFFFFSDTSRQHDVFHLIAPLGSGVAAEIFLANRQNHSQNRLFAVKRMRRSLVLSDDFAHDPLSEQLALKIITSLNCPFLPRLYASFIDERYLYLVTVSAREFWQPCAHRRE